MTARAAARIFSFAECFGLARMVFSGLLFEHTNQSVCCQAGERMRGSTLTAAVSIDGLVSSVVVALDRDSHCLPEADVDGIQRMAVITWAWILPSTGHCRILR